MVSTRASGLFSQLFTYWHSSTYWHSTLLLGLANIAPTCAGGGSLELLLLVLGGSWTHNPERWNLKPTSFLDSTSAIYLSNSGGWSCMHQTNPSKNESRQWNGRWTDNMNYIFLACFISRQYPSQSRNWLRERKKILKGRTSE